MLLQTLYNNFHLVDTKSSHNVELQLTSLKYFFLAYNRYVYGRVGV